MKLSRMMPHRCDGGDVADATPICRCRVLYMGSAVPHITKDGLQGIQEPLRELYPEQGALGARGIDSWLSVWSNGLLLENVDENHKKVTRFFPIETLHYCAAVRYVLVPEKASNNPSVPRFLPLDSPFARTPNPNHPPLFAAILRRTTGIKVLECHAFICKREMAANALVRCCFHAYADSSYAKQIDDKSSEYGTLSMTIRPDSDTLDRVEGWRQQNNRNGTSNGSMLTLNTHNGDGTATLRSVDQMTIGDDMSVYNGDENHKVWAGLSANDNIYGEASYSSSTIRSGKTSRPRQAMPLAPAPMPPPTPPIKQDNNKLKKQDKNKRKSASREDISQIHAGAAAMRNAHSISNMNMAGRGGGVGVSAGVLRMAHPPHHPPPQPIYSNGTLIRPIMYMPATATLPHPGSKKKIVQHAGTFSHRPKNAMKLAPHMIPMPGQQMLIPSKKGKHYPPTIYTMEEPIYMPSARPLSPVASYQPAHFPHEAYLMQQYATMETGKRQKKGKKKNTPYPLAVPIPIPMPGTIVGNGGAGGGMYMTPLAPPNGHPFAPQHAHVRAHPPHDSPTGLEHNGEEVDTGPRQEDDEESPFNTGIYRKKGHLNERAFSYSIRQEHRSRSYGSLANLKFATPIPNGRASPGTGSMGLGANEQVKREREMQHMMQELELTGDELERSEVPRAVYESKRLQAVNAHAASANTNINTSANAKSHRS